MSSSSSSTVLQQKSNVPLVVKTFFSVITTLALVVLLIILLAQLLPLSVSVTDFTSCSNSSSKLRALQLNSYETIDIILNSTAVLLSFLVSLYLILNVTDCCQCTCKAVLRQHHQKDLRLSKITNQRKLAQKNKKRKKQNSVDTEWQQNLQQFECDDLESCIQFCCVCGCCRVCRDAHQFLFYQSKSKEYAYWIVYLAKSWILIILLLHFIQNFSVLQNLSACMSSNAQNYKSQCLALLIIAAICVLFDLIGYIYICIQGSLFDPLQDSDKNPKLKAEYYLINLKVIDEQQQPNQNKQRQVNQQQIKIQTTQQEMGFFSRVQQSYSKIIQNQSKGNVQHKNNKSYTKQMEMKQDDPDKKKKKNSMASMVKIDDSILNSSVRQSGFGSKPSTFRQMIRQNP